MKKETGKEKSKFYFLAGLICIFGGFYIDNMDAGRILLEVIGFVSVIMGLMACKKPKDVLLLGYAFVILAVLIVVDYGFVKAFQKIPIFAVSKEETYGTAYQGMFYKVWVCDDEKTYRIRTKAEKYSCPIPEVEKLRAELATIKKEQEELEKNPCSLTQTVTLSKRLGVEDETGTKEYILLTRFQRNPLLGLVSKSQLDSMKEGTTYEFTFLGVHESGIVDDTELFEKFSLNLIQETNKTGAEQLFQTTCD